MRNCIICQLFPHLKLLDKHEGDNIIVYHQHTLGYCVPLTTTVPNNVIVEHTKFNLTI